MSSLFPVSRRLRVFLCHSFEDKFVVRELYQRLLTQDWIDAWFDEVRLLPGQDWRMHIEEAVEHSDIVIICLSKNSINKEGFVQKELRYAKEIALEKPEGATFLIPLRLQECEVPRGLRIFQWANYYDKQKEQGFAYLLEALRMKFNQLNRRETEARPEEKNKSIGKKDKESNITISKDQPQMNREIGALDEHQSVRLSDRSRGDGDRSDFSIDLKNTERHERRKPLGIKRSYSGSLPLSQELLREIDRTRAFYKVSIAQAVLQNLAFTSREDVLRHLRDMNNKTTEYEFNDFIQGFYVVLLACLFGFQKIRLGSSLTDKMIDELRSPDAYKMAIRMNLEQVVRLIGEDISATKLMLTLQYDLLISKSSWENDGIACAVDTFLSYYSEYIKALNET